MAAELGIKTKANIVMSGEHHANRIKKLLDKYSESVSIRILEDLDVGYSSAISIYNLLADLKAVPVKRKFDAGASNAQTIFRLQNGREIGFKQIRMTRLSNVCNTCTLNNPNDCKEGYYGVRVYTDDKGDYKVGVCLQRMDLTVPIEDFMNSDIPESIKLLRQKEFEEMVQEYGDKAVII